MYKNRLQQIREGISVKLYNRDEPPLTQEKLAKVCKVSRQTIWSIEAEKSMPSYPVAIKIYAHLKKFEPKLKINELFPIPT